MGGWIKLHRKLQDSDMFKNLTSKQRDVMIQLIFLANHEPHEWEWKGKIFKVKRGQCITSIDGIKERCANDVSFQNIRTALVKLEKWQFLTNESTKTGRLITVLNYDRYQDKDIDANKDTNRQPTDSQQTANKQLTSNKKNKEGLKNDKEYKIQQNLIKKELEFQKEAMTFSDKYSVEMIENFVRCWTEKNKAKTKLRFEIPPTFEISKRLATWKRNNYGQSDKRNHQTGSVATYEEHKKEKFSDFQRT